MAAEPVQWAAQATLDARLISGPRPHVSKPDWRRLILFLRVLLCVGAALNKSAAAKIAPT